MIYYPNATVPREIFLTEFINRNKKEKSKNDIYQYVTLALTIILLCVGSAFCPTCACTGVNAIVTVGCGMGIVAIAGIALNSIIFLKGLHLDKIKKRLSRETYFSIDQIFTYFQEKDNQALIHNIDPNSPNGIKEFVNGIKDRKIPKNLLEHLKTYRPLKLQKEYPALFTNPKDSEVLVEPQDGVLEEKRS